MLIDPLAQQCTCREQKTFQGVNGPRKAGIQIGDPLLYVEEDSYTILGQQLEATNNRGLNSRDDINGKLS